MSEPLAKAGRATAEDLAALWIVDPEAKTLTVHRHQSDGYLVVLAAGPEVRSRAPIFGADPDDWPGADEPTE